MKKLNQLKKLLKQEGIWKSYKNKFTHKQVRLIFSKIVLIFRSAATLEELVSLEKAFFESTVSNQEKMFTHLSPMLEEATEIKADWKSLTKHIFYVFQTSTYFKDEKKGKKNFFTKNNYVKRNSEKRDFYFKWIKSLNHEDKEFNNKVIKVLKVVR